MGGAAQTAGAVLRLVHRRSLRSAGPPPDGLPRGRAATNGCTGASATSFVVFSPVVPTRFRKHPRASAGLDRASGRIPADTPLVHTPARNLPPLDERDNPMHYCPKVS